MPGRTITDTATAAGAATVPLWAAYLDASMSIAAGLGAVVLVWLRVAIIWREWRKGRSQAPGE